MLQQSLPPGNYTVVMRGRGDGLVMAVGNGDAAGMLAWRPGIDAAKFVARSADDTHQSPDQRLGILQGRQALGEAGGLGHTLAIPRERFALH